MANGSHRGPLIDRRRFVGGLIATGALMALPGCARRITSTSATPTSDESTATPSGADGAGLLRFYIPNPAYIEPYDVHDVAGKLVCNALFEPLVRYDYLTGEVVPAAATSWTVDESGTIFRFDIAAGATFHNGETVDARSFKRGWERIANPQTDTTSPSSVAGLLAPIAGFQEMRDGTSDELSGVRVVNDLTLEVTLSSPYPGYLYTFSHPALSPVPEAASDRGTFAAAPIGNGPFQISGQWVDEQYIRLVRNEGFHGDPPSIEGVDFLIFRDESTAYLEFQAGNLDFSAVPVSEYSAATSSYARSSDGMTVTEEGKLLTGDEMAVRFILLNCDDPAFGKDAFRRALSLSINREALVNDVFGGMHSPADGIIPPAMEGSRAGAWASCTYDLEAAEAAMVEAGYPNGNGAPALTLTCSSAGPSRDIMNKLADFWAAIGVDTTVSVDTPALHDAERRQGRYQVMDMAWMADTPLREDFFSALFSSSSETNYSRYSDPSFDSALASARAIADATAHADAVDVLDGMIAQSLPVIPLYFYNHHHVGSDSITELAYDPFCNASLSTCQLSDNS